jgi:phage tail sheath protein FI
MGDRFAILDAHDPIRGDRHLPVDAVLSEAASLKSSFGALYFPWVGTDRAAGTLGLMAPAPGSQEWRRPAPASETRVHGGLLFGPPCGHIAGLIARTDAVFGPQRSPANLRLDDAIDVSVSLSAEQQALLNEHGVNFLRGRRGSGVEVGAARTLRRDSAWAYVSTARVILCFRRWLEAGMREFVFESNTPELWDRIGLRLTAKCSEMWREGGLAGGDPAGAFFVKCDAETNSADDVERGCVIAEVGLAPSVPAEFIIVRVEFDPNGITVSALF